MSDKPSNEAVAAAKAVNVYADQRQRGLEPYEVGECARIIDRHFAPLRQRIAELEAACDKAYRIMDERIEPKVEALIADRDRLAAEVERLREYEEHIDPDKMKVAVCEYLLSLNEGSEPFIPPTAIDWIGNGAVAAVLECIETENAKAREATREAAEAAKEGGDA